MNNHQTDALQSLITTANNSQLPAAEYIQLAKLLLANERWDDALTFIKKALMIDQTQCDQIEAILGMDRLYQQTAIKEKIITLARSIYPNNLSLYLALSIFFRDTEKFAEAEQLLLEIIQQLPNNIRPLHRLASIYIRMMRYQEAIQYCQSAIRLDPNSEYAFFNQGLAQLGLNKISSAQDSFNKVIEINPKNAHAQLKLASISLKQGDFKTGWQLFNARWATKDLMPNNFSQFFPQWQEWKRQQNNTIKTQHILLWPDQGIGDCIMYAGMINRMIEQGYPLTLMVYPKLEPIFKRSFPSCDFIPHTTELTESTIPKDIGTHIPLSDLPSLFIHSFDDFKPSKPYLLTEGKSVSAVKNTLQQKFPGKKLIGFSWRGGLSITEKYSRCIDLARWSKLLKHPEYQLINLQYDSSEAENQWIAQQGGYTPPIDLKDDIDSVAAYLSALDLFLCVDNTTTHLAGALGVNTCTLLPFSSEWRWFDSEQCYWYPSMHLVRQPAIHDWDYCLRHSEQFIKR